MDAVLRINLQSGFTINLYILIDTGRAIALLWTGISLQVDVYRYRIILKG
jgi:hypothetical protein